MPRRKKYFANLKKKEAQERARKERLEKEAQERARKEREDERERRQRERLAKLAKEESDRCKRIADKRRSISMHSLVGSPGGYLVRGGPHRNSSFRVPECESCKDNSILTYIAFAIMKASAFCTCHHCHEKIYRPLKYNKGDLEEVIDEPSEYFPKGLRYFKDPETDDTFSPDIRDKIIGKISCPHCYEEIEEDEKQLRPGQESVIIEEICKTMFTLYFNEKHILVKVEVEGGQLTRCLNSVYTEFNVHVHYAVELLLATYFQDFKFIDHRLNVMKEEFDAFKLEHLKASYLNRFKWRELYPGEEPINWTFGTAFKDIQPCWCCGKPDRRYHGCDRYKLRSIKGAYLMIVLPMIYKLDFTGTFQFSFDHENWIFHKGISELSMCPEYEFVSDQYASFYRCLWYHHCRVAQKQPWLKDDLDIEDYEVEESSDSY